MVMECEIPAFLHSLTICNETGRRRPRALIRTEWRSRSGRGRAGSRRAAEAMRDDARRRCGPGKGADRTGRRRTARSGPRGARRARRPGAHAAKPQPAEASRPGRSAKQAGRDAQRSKHRDPGLWSRMPGISAPGMPSRMGSRAGGGDGGLHAAEPPSAARPPRGRPGARPGIRDPRHRGPSREENEPSTSPCAPPRDRTPQKWGMSK